MGDGNTNYIVCLSFPVSQSKFNWLCHVSQLLWETQKTPHILAQWNMIGYRLFASDPTGNLFYLHAAIFEISKQCSIMKPPAPWGVDVSIEIYISMHKQDHLKSSPFFFIFVSRIKHVIHIFVLYDFQKYSSLSKKTYIFTISSSLNFHSDIIILH